ncbi:MAG: hypothetical protein ABIL44_05970 [candidate division WOR-3 bacterium]
MKFILDLLLPINLVTLGGLILMILGFLLIPFLIGFPIFIIGMLLLIYGILSHFIKFLPGGKTLRDYMKTQSKKN